MHVPCHLCGERRESFASVPSAQREKMALDLNARAEGPERRVRIVLQLDGSSLHLHRSQISRPSKGEAMLCSALLCSASPPLLLVSYSASTPSKISLLFRVLPKALHCISLVPHTPLANSA
jgi:hypothetical protein